MGKKKPSSFEHVEPIGDRVLVRKDEPKRETRGGIALPDAAEIPTITGRIVTISAVVENDEELPLRQYDKILFHPKNAIPVDLEHDNQLFVVPVEDVVGSADETLQELNSTVAALHTVLQSDGIQSLPDQLELTLAELDRTLRRVSELAASLESQPSSLIFSRPPSPDPEPAAGAP